MKRSAIKDLGRKIEGGAWVRKLPGMDDLQVKVRARFNTDYVRRQKELFEAEPEQNKPEGHLTPEAARRHDAILILDTILIDWFNMTEDQEPAEKGKEPPPAKQIPYSREEAEAMLLNPEEPAFLNAVNYAAMVVADQGELDMKAAEGNSRRRSAGS